MNSAEIEQAAGAYALLPVGWRWLNPRPDMLALEGAPDTFAWQRLPPNPQLGDIAGAAERCMCTLAQVAAEHEGLEVWRQ